MKINLDLNEVNLILDILSQAPYRTVAPLVHKLQTEVMIAQTTRSDADHSPASGNTEPRE